MAPNSRNYLLGRGERLIEPLQPPTGGRQPESPYMFEEARIRLSSQAATAAVRIEQLPADACPNNEATLIATMHPQFTAKTYFPSRLISRLSLRVLGSRPVKVTPQKWKSTTKNPPESAETFQLYLAGDRRAIHELSTRIAHINEDSPEATDLRRIEGIRYFDAGERIRVPEQPHKEILEVALHTTGAGQGSSLPAFKAFIESRGGHVFDELRVYAGSLVFVPVEMAWDELAYLDQFSFLRVARAMPTIRALRPPIRSAPVDKRFPYRLPDSDAINPETRVAILDGGTNGGLLLARWANQIVPANVGPVDPEFADHGDAVVSSFLFGPLMPTRPADVPPCRVDNIQVLDINDRDDPLALFRAIHRIADVLADSRYEFINLSLGPDIPIEDDEISVWTAAIDYHLGFGDTLMTVAAGNSGELDDFCNNSRIQPPSDALNVLSVGACDRDEGNGWNKTVYSSIGPGRSPGLVKPDVVAFGGCDGRPFCVVSTDSSFAAPITGTSFAAPLALRTASLLRTLYGNQDLSVAAIRALLVHRAERSASASQYHVGWGRISRTPSHLIECADDEVTVVYQGAICPGKYQKAPLTIPDIPLTGKVEIDATIAFFTETDPQDPGNYSRGGIEVVFRPSVDKVDPKSLRPKTRQLFSKKKMGFSSEAELRRGAFKWESLMHAHDTIMGSGLKDPCLELHYVAREEGHPTDARDELQFALVITIRAPRHANFYEMVHNQYQAELTTLVPLVEIPVQVTL